MIAVRKGWASLKVRAVVCLAALACGATAFAAVREAPRASVLKVRVGGDANETRVVIEMDGAAAGKLVEGQTPTQRVLLALPQVSLAGDMAGQGVGLVRGWAMDDAAGSARLKLTLARDATVTRRFLLPPGDGVTIYRYVVDVQAATSATATKTVQARSGAPAGALAAAAAAAAAPSATLAPTPVRIEAPTVSPAARKVVVIDAGHGGRDPGSRGVEMKEKEVTLAAARALRDALDRTGRYKVVMTRDSDVFVALEERVRIARRANADLFIVLHADSIADPTLRGASVYTLSDRGAARTANGLFNASNWFIDMDLPGKDPGVNRILLDLTQRETQNRSGAFAEVLLDKISERTTLLRRSHRDAGFMVLLAPDVPAVLLEMGFMTNPEDEKALADPAHRRRLMQGVANAIDTYFGEEKRYASR
jgi:N-acetylmuramoyl-L-alanine amidase